MSTATDSRSTVSSAADTVIVRSMSPKSKCARPGMTVSRSITQTALSVCSSSMTLLIFASLCAIRIGRSPAAMSFEKSVMCASVARAYSISGPQDPARSCASWSSARRNCSSRDIVSWKPGIVSCKGGPGRSSMRRWNQPKAAAASRACAGDSTALTVRAP